MNEAFKSPVERGPVKAIEIPLATQKMIAKLWQIHDSLEANRQVDENGARHIALVRHVIERLHTSPLVSNQPWLEPEEAWLREQIEAGNVQQTDFKYLLDCMTSEARFDVVESWSRHLHEALRAQESEVPLPAEYEKDPSAPAPYKRLRDALNTLPDNPNEQDGDSWIDRATRLGLIPVSEKRRYLDIFLGIRQKAEFLRDEERRQRMMDRE